MEQQDDKESTKNKNKNLWIVMLIGAFIITGGILVHSEEPDASHAFIEKLGDSAKETLEQAKSGDAQAQYRIAAVFYQGERAPKRYDLAAKWSRKAAEQDQPDAKALLGFLYESGEGVTKDIGKAESLYREGAGQGSTLAQYRLASFLAHNGGDPEQIEEATLKAAENGTARAQYLMGERYLSGRWPSTPDGKDLGKDYDKASFWYKKAADNGDAWAYFQLAQMYFAEIEGEAVPANEMLAIAHLREASDRGIEQASELLAEVDPSHDSSTDRASGTGDDGQGTSAGVVRCTLALQQIEQYYLAAERNEVAGQRASAREWRRRAEIRTRQARDRGCFQ